MLDLRNANMNDVITIQEAEKILEIAKDAYPGLIDDVFICYDDEMGYSFTRTHSGEKYITIYSEFPYWDDLEEVGEKILSYVNDQFNADFKLNMKVETINAFCHEIGHAIDFAQKERDNDHYYEPITDEEYDYYRIQAHKVREEILEFKEYCYMYDIEFDDDCVAEWYNYIVEMQDDLDYEYRMITTEYFADEFSVEFMYKYLSDVPELFNNYKGMMVEC